MKICILDAKTLGADLSLEPINKCGEVTIYDLTSPENVAERIKDADVILTNKVVLNESNLKNAKNVKLIGLFATGYNNIDVAYAKSKNIGVCNVAGYSTDSVAQHTFAILFQILEQLSFYDHYVKSKAYAKSDTFAYIERPFYEVTGKVWGIIGMGAIGRKVAEIATCFGAKVIYYSTTGQNNSVSYTRVSLDEILSQSDILSIHAPLNATTHNLIGYTALEKMKESAILLNLGRGGIVNEEELAKGLEANLIRGAALDVLEKEPIDENNPLFNVTDASKWLVTPHIAWASVEARELLVEEVVENIQAFARGIQRNRVD